MSLCCRSLAGFLAVSMMAVVLSAACSSKDKKQDSPTPVAASLTMTREDIAQKFSLVDLNGTATLLRAVVDEGASKPNEDKGTDLIGCRLTARQAGTMTMPVKALIDQSMRAEVESYTANPKNYASEKGFETCAATCACGMWSDIVEGANESAMPKGSARTHARNQQRLTLKASHQSSSDTVACARKQTWFCTSDLKTYLLKDAASNAE